MIPNALGAGERGSLDLRVLELVLNWTILGGVNYWEKNRDVEEAKCRSLEGK